MKQFTALILALLLLLTGCSAPEEVQTGTDHTVQYDWMAGTSPVSADRTGGRNNAIGQVNNGFECTDTGCYWMCSPGYLFYSDHGSDEVILLCGRPDCAHDNQKCNAYFDKGYNVCWYDGHLFVLSGSNLIRLDPDGSDRETVLKPKEVLEDGGHGLWAAVVWNDMYSINVYLLDEDGNEYMRQYCTKLDSDFSSMTEISVWTPAATDGDHYIVMDDARRYLQLWDPETDELTDLTPEHGMGFYGAEECWYIEDGIVYRNVYATGETTAMLDTGLEGSLALLCFNDCFIVANAVEAGVELVHPDEQVLRIYNWNMELVNVVELDYPNATVPFDPVCGESAERIYLSDSLDNVPRYYIEKSELGGENVELHPLTLPEHIVEMLESEDAVLVPPTA